MHLRYQLSRFRRQFQLEIPARIWQPSQIPPCQPFNFGGEPVPCDCEKTLSRWRRKPSDSDSCTSCACEMLPPSPSLLAHGIGLHGCRQQAITYFDGMRLDQIQAILHDRPLWLTQAWLVPFWTTTSPDLRCATSPLSSSMSSSPSRTMP